jgi:peptide-methionine (S)-S-oxide reductase
MEYVLFGMGCFWGAERKMWETEGVFTTAVGYSGGHTPNPTYEEVCTGLTGHNEVVLVVYDPAIIGFTALLSLFWENHDPTQGMRQGNDIGTQYRSTIHTFTDQQYRSALESHTAYEASLAAAGYGDITTEILQASNFYYAEHNHQQYLAKVPNGYCAMDGTGVCYTPRDSEPSNRL